jgi:hypothetical protein
MIITRGSTLQHLDLCLAAVISSPYANSFGQGFLASYANV